MNDKAIQNFPNDVTLLILQYLNMKELNICSLLSKNWQQLSRSENLWRKLSKNGLNRDEIILANKVSRLGEKLQNCDSENLKSTAQKLNISLPKMIELGQQIHTSKIKGDFNIIILYIRQLMEFFKVNFSTSLNGLSNLGTFNALVLDKGNSSGNDDTVYDNSLSIQIDSSSIYDIGLGNRVQNAISNIRNFVSKFGESFYIAFKPQSFDINLKNQIGITFALITCIIAEDKVLQTRLSYQNNTIESFIKKILSENNLDIGESKRIINNIKSYVPLIKNHSDQEHKTNQLKI